MISTQNISNYRPTENRRWLIETESNLDFDTFLADVSAVQIGYFSNQAESDEIYQLFWTSYLLPTTFHLGPHII